MSAGTATPRRSRGPYARSQVTQGALLDAAFAVFAESGYRNGSVRVIAERAGVSVTSLVHHFGSKSGLLLAVLEQRDLMANDRFAWTQQHGLDALRVAVEIMHYNTTTPSLNALYCTLSAEAIDREHPAHGYFVARQRRARSSFAQAFSEIAEEAGLRPGLDPDTAALLTMSTLEGLQLLWLLERQVVDMAGALRAHFNALLVGRL